MQQNRYSELYANLPNDRRIPLIPVLEMMPCGIVIANSKGQIIFWNKADERMFGWTFEEAMGMPLTILMPERYKVAHQIGIQNVVRNGKSSASKVLGQSVKLAGIRKNGDEFPIEIYVTDYHWSENNHFFFSVIQELGPHYLKIELELMERMLSQIGAEVDRVSEIGTPEELPATKSCPFNSKTSTV